MNGKLLLLAGLGLGTSLIITYSSLAGWEKTWRLWNVQPMYPCFADARVITRSAETKALGIEPLGRELNYPRIWEMLSLAGVNQSHTVGFGITLATLLAIGLVLVTPATLDKTTAAVLLGSAFSPAVMLGVERGNIDLLMFFLLAAAVFCMKKTGAGPRVLAVGLVLFAFVLKLFPWFGMGLVLNQKKAFAIKAGLVALVFALVYAAATYADLVVIRHVTPQNPFHAYGIDTLWMKADNSTYEGIIVAELSYTAVVACLMLALFGICSRKFWHTDATDNDPRTLDAFRVGAGVFIGTFLLGNNGDYRLVFLLFVIPQLIFWSRRSAAPVSRVARGLVPIILLSLWSMLLERPAAAHLGFAAPLAHDASNWLIFAGLLFLFVCSVPTWIKEAASNLDALLRRSAVPNEEKKKGRTTGPALHTLEN
ncbi:MAG TPA: hypothetical protein VMB80_09440 [Candidatus Acidoferrum sp.]|nr:hypothetical protein [Candidatus Acidoferrum sp.]